MASGFGTHGSDVDVTCFRADAPEDEAGLPGGATLLRERLGPLLQEHPDFVILEKILSAKVPLLKLRFGGMLDIDLSCHNTQALRNTRLLRAYAQFDNRVRDLCILVKLWAKSSQVCGASGGHLSSYTFTLMTIYFMQVHLELPCLPTSDFNDGRDESGALERVHTARAYWCCDLSLADLICRFFWFYNFDFEWGSEVISTRLGIRRYATDELFQLLRGRHTPRIHVEDPYRLERNLHCVLGGQEEVQLRTAFAEAMQSLHLGRTPYGLRPERPGPWTPQDKCPEPSASDRGADEVGAATPDLKAAAEATAGVPAEMGMAGVGTGAATDASPADGAAECELTHPDGGISEDSTACDCSSSERRSPCSSWSSDDEKSRGRSQSSDDEWARAPQCNDKGCDLQQGSNGLTTSASAKAETKGGQEDAGEGARTEESRGEDRNLWLWWQHLESANVAKAVKDIASTEGLSCSHSDTQRQSRCLTVQELEDSMGETKAGHAVLDKGGLPMLDAQTFKAKSTRAIAARVSKLCREHVRYQ